MYVNFCWPRGRKHPFAIRKQSGSSIPRYYVGFQPARWKGLSNPWRRHDRVPYLLARERWKHFWQAGCWLYPACAIYYSQSYLAIRPILVGGCLRGKKSRWEGREPCTSSYSWHVDLVDICTLIVKECAQCLNYAGSEIPCLYGSTCFRDNLEDEWLIIYLLFSISRLYPQLVIRSVQPANIPYLIKLKLRISHPGPCKTAYWDQWILLMTMLLRNL